MNINSHHDATITLFTERIYIHIICTKILAKDIYILDSINFFSFFLGGERNCIILNNPKEHNHAFGAREFHGT